MRFTRKSTETFIFRKKLLPRKLDEKAGILRCERMETIAHFRKNMMAQPSFYYQKGKNKRLERTKFFGRQYVTKLRETILKAKYGFFIN